jgi:hypothetical protein
LSHIADRMSLLSLVSTWGLLLAGFYYARRVRTVEGTGLLAAYLISFCGLHWVGGLIRLFPWFKDRSLVATTLGLERSTYALAALIAGSLFISPLIARFVRARRGKAGYMPAPRLARIYLIIGVISYLLLLTFISRLPSMAAVISAGEGLYVAGLCLICWNAIQQKRAAGLLGGLALALTMPLITIITQGFMGYGAAAAVVVFSFLGSIVSRWKIALIGALACYLGLSVYVTYMRDRTEIRTVVWGAQPMEERLNQIEQTFAAFEWFNPYDSAHLNRIDVRMNQNLLVGRAVARLSETQDFANGETVWSALVALVPRALWPDKPVVAGSGDLVSHYTGLHFGEFTSVGIGQVLEFYINFGTIGVIVGFLLLGAILTTVDITAHARLVAGDHQGFVLWFVSGMGMLQAGGSLAELTASVAGGLITVAIVNRYFLPHLQQTYFASPATIPASSSSR